MNTEQPRIVAFFDIDGVIANDTHRLHFAQEKKWVDYFNPKNLEADEVWPQGRAAVLNELRQGNEVQYLTGRRSDLIKTTTRWFEDNNLYQAATHGRPFGVRTPLAIFKADFLEEYEKEVGAQIRLYEDDPEVVRVVRERLGREDAAIHCTWHIKPSYLVKKAVA